jgi:hypothetical protein
VFINLAANQIADVEAAGWERYAFAERDLDFEAYQFLGVGD